MQAQYLFITACVQLFKLKFQFSIYQICTKEHFEKRKKMKCCFKTGKDLKAVHMKDCCFLSSSSCYLHVKKHKLNLAAIVHGRECLDCIPMHCYFQVLFRPIYFISILMACQVQDENRKKSNPNIMLRSIKFYFNHSSSAEINNEII